MSRQQELVIDQVNRKLEVYRSALDVQVPEKGWIRTIRITLNMTLDQLGRRMGISRQGARKVEMSEANGSITISSLHKVGNALDMNFVYGFVPKEESLDDLISKQAKYLAEKISGKTHRNMVLEEQGIEEDQLLKAIDTLAKELRSDLDRRIWD